MKTTNKTMLLLTLLSLSLWAPQLMAEADSGGGGMKTGQAITNIGNEEGQGWEQHTETLNIVNVKGKEGGCNPLEANACGEGKVCWTDMSLEEILATPDSYKCKKPEECGSGATCALVSAPANVTGPNGSALSAQVCIPKGTCVDTTVKVNFETYVPAEFSFNLDTKQCVQLLKGEKVSTEVQNKEMSKEQLDQMIQVYTGDVLRFTSELEAATAVMDDYFNINKKGQEFAILFNKSRDTTQEAYIESRILIEKKYEQMINDVKEQKTDMASSVEYYDFMASIFELEASSSAAFLKQFTDIHDNLDQWGQRISIPKNDYYDVGQFKDKALATFLGIETSEIKKKVEDNQGNTKTVTEKVEIPKYELRFNICQQMGKRNGDCVQMCEYKGMPVADPIVEVEKKKKSAGFLGLGRLFCNIGNLFKKEDTDCKYKYTEKLADHFVEYGTSPQCSYIARDINQSAIMNKLITIKTIREKVSTLANFYETAYKMNTELAQCMKQFSGKISGLYQGQSSKYVEENDGTDGDGPALSDQGNLEISGNPVNVTADIKAQGFALAAYKQKLKDSLVGEKEDSFIRASVDPLGSSNGQQALRNSLKKFHETRDEVKKKAQRFADNARRSGKDSSSRNALQKYRTTASKLNIGFDESSKSDPYNFGSAYAAFGSSSLLNGNNLTNGDSSELNSGKGSSGSLTGNSKSAAAMAQAKKDAEAAAKAKALALAAAKAKAAKAAHAGKNGPQGEQADDDDSKKKIADGEEVKEGEEVLAENETEIPLPPNFDEFDMASMLNDVQSDQYKYSRRPNDSLWDIITKTYMRSAIKTIYGDRKAQVSQD